MNITFVSPRSPHLQLRNSNQSSVSQDSKPLLASNDSVHFGLVKKPAKLKPEDVYRLEKRGSETVVIIDLKKSIELNRQLIERRKHREAIAMKVSGTFLMAGLAVMGADLAGLLDDGHSHGSETSISAEQHPASTPSESPSVDKHDDHHHEESAQAHTEDAHESSGDLQQTIVEAAIIMHLVSHVTIPVAAVVLAGGGLSRRRSKKSYSQEQVNAGEAEREWMELQRNQALPEGSAKDRARGKKIPRKLKKLVPLLDRDPKINSLKKRLETQNGEEIKIWGDTQQDLVDQAIKKVEKLQRIREAALHTTDGKEELHLTLPQVEELDKLVKELVLTFAHLNLIYVPYPEEKKQGIVRRILGSLHESHHS